MFSQATVHAASASLNLSVRSLPDHPQDKSQLSEEHLPELSEVLGDEGKAKEVLDAARASMGQDISPIDLINMSTFASRVIKLAEYRCVWCGCAHVLVCVCVGGG